jgi:hypothetical protein
MLGTLGALSTGVDIAQEIERDEGVHTSSQHRGAKQLVVVTIQVTFSRPSSSNLASRAAMSVWSSSPTSFGSITTGTRLAEAIAFRQVF